MRPSRPAHGRALEQDRVLDLGRLDHAVAPDRRVRADVGVDQPRAGADDRRARGRSCARAPRPARRRRGRRSGESTSSPSTRRSSVSRIRRLASSMSSRRPVSFHQPRTTCDSTACCGVDEPLDRVGDLQLAAAGRLDRPRGLVDPRREHVDADQREVGRGLGRLLHQPRHAAVAVELGDAEVLRVRDAGEQDQRLGLVAAGTRPRGPRSRPGAGCRRGTSRTGRCPRNGSAVSTACASPSGASCSM